MHSPFFDFFDIFSHFLQKNKKKLEISETVVNYMKSKVQGTYQCYNVDNISQDDL